MGHPRTEPQFDPLALERLLNQRMTGALQFGDHMSGGKIFLERKAALGDRIVRRRDADVVGIEQKLLIELSGKLRQETDGDIGLAGFKRFGCVLDRQVQRTDRDTRCRPPSHIQHARQDHCLGNIGHDDIERPLHDRRLKRAGLLQRAAQCVQRCAHIGHQPLGNRSRGNTMAFPHEEWIAQTFPQPFWRIPDRGLCRAEIVGGTQYVPALHHRIEYHQQVLEKPDDACAPPEIDLPNVAKKVGRELVANPKDFLEVNFNDAKASGLSAEGYIEIVGIVSRVTDMDVFARGIGVALRPLPAPGPGEPSRERPEAEM